MKCGIVLAVLALAAAATTPAVAQTFVAVKQFSIAHNPNGAWSYLSAGALMTDTLKSCAGLSNFKCRWNGQSEPNSAIVGANKTTGNLSYDTIVLPPNTIVLDPEDASPVVVEWTAPSAGTITVAGSFVGIDTDEASHSVAVLHNGTALATYTIAHYQQKQPFRFQLSVATGDTIGFASYSQGFAYLSTGLQAHITLAPD